MMSGGNCSGLCIDNRRPQTSTLGSSCVFADCVPGLRCAATETGLFCFELDQVGEPCTLLSCELPAFCSERSNLCMPLGQAGAACSSNFECASQFVCSGTQEEGVCSLPLRVGHRCRGVPSDDCGGIGYCADNGRCELPALLGDACSQQLGARVYCYASFCQSEPFGPGVCTKYREVGEECPLGHECSPGLRCDPTFRICAHVLTPCPG